MTLGEVDAMFRTARRVLKFVRPELLEEFTARSNAIAKAFIEERGLSVEESREQLLQPSANQLDCGEKSLAKFEELKRWLTDQNIHPVLVVI